MVVTTIEARAAASHAAEPAFLYVGFGENAVDYQRAWATQRELHGQRVVDEIGDVVMLLEHPPVYTAGRRTEPKDRPIDGTPVVEVDRGGKITWHGPGQLVGYPITKLPGHVYVVDFVRRLEEALIRTCADLGLATHRVPGRSGVWVSAGDPGSTEATTRQHASDSSAVRERLLDSTRATPRQYASDSSAVRERPVGGMGAAERKVAALGVRVSGGVTMHGFALNCNCDLSGFDAIIPCGLDNAEVTSLSRELGRDVSVEETVPLVAAHLRDLLSWAAYDRS